MDSTTRQPSQRNMYMIGAYKDFLINILASNEDMQIAISGKNNSYQETRSKIYDYAFAPDVSDNSDVYICLDITVPSIFNNSLKELMIQIYVFSPKSFVDWKNGDWQDVSLELNKRGYCGNRIDTIVDIIDREINDRRNVGLGRIHLNEREPLSIFNHQSGFYGKCLVYRTVDFNILPSSTIQYEYKDGQVDWSGVINK